MAASGWGKQRKTRANGTSFISSGPKLKAAQSVDVLFPDCQTLGTQNKKQTNKKTT